MTLWGSKLSWMISVIAIIGDFVVPYMLAVFYPRYSHFKHVMSLLGNPKSPVAFIYNIWLIILGILVSITAVNFYIVYLHISKTYASIGAVILLIFGIGAGIIAGIFSVSDSGDIETKASKIHGIGAGIGFIVLTFLPLVMSIVLFKENSIAIGIISIICFILSVFFFVLFIISEKETYKKSIIGFTGMWQRLLLGSMYMPLLIISIREIIV